MNQKPFLKVLANAAYVAIVFIAIQTVHPAHADGDVSVSQLLKGGGASEPREDARKDPARKQRAWQLYKIWMARDKRDVVLEIIPYLTDDQFRIRQSAARMLGQLENPVAEPALQVALIPNDGDNYIRPTIVKLALGRIRARDLKGEAKITALLRSVGLSFEEATPLTAGFVAAWSRANNSPAEAIVNDLVNVLYTMGKRGENITPIVERLTLYPAQQVKLKAAVLPLGEEIETIIAYLSKCDVITEREHDLMLHLMQLGSPATESVLRHLAAMEKGQEQYNQEGITTLFEVVGISGDPRAVPLLKLFEAKPDPIVRHYAMLSRQTAEHLQDWPSFQSPYPPLL